MEDPEQTVGLHCFLQATGARNFRTFTILIILLNYINIENTIVQSKTLNQQKQLLFDSESKNNSTIKKHNHKSDKEINRY